MVERAKKERKRARRLTEIKFQLLREEFKELNQNTEASSSKTQNTSPWGPGHFLTVKQNKELIKDTAELSTILQTIELDPRFDEAYEVDRQAREAKALQRLKQEEESKILALDEEEQALLKRLQTLGE